MKSRDFLDDLLLHQYLIVVFFTQPESGQLGCSDDTGATGLALYIFDGLGACALEFLQSSKELFTLLRMCFVNLSLAVKYHEHTVTQFAFPHQVLFRLKHFECQLLSNRYEDSLLEIVEVSDPKHQIQRNIEQINLCSLVALYSDHFFDLLSVHPNFIPLIQKSCSFRHLII